MSTIQIEKSLTSLGGLFASIGQSSSGSWFHENLSSLVSTAARSATSEAKELTSDADIGVVDLLSKNLIESNFKIRLVEILEDDPDFANDLYSAVSTLESNEHVTRVDVSLDSSDEHSTVVVWAWLDESEDIDAIESNLYEWFSRLDDSFAEQSMLAIF